MPPTLLEPAPMHTSLPEVGTPLDQLVELLQSPPEGFVHESLQLAALAGVAQINDPPVAPNTDAANAAPRIERRERDFLFIGASFGVLTATSLESDR